jgi:hypothetical protein
MDRFSEHPFVTDHFFDTGTEIEIANPTVDHDGPRRSYPSAAALADRGKRAPLLDISPPNNKRTNGYISGATNGNIVTPRDEVIETPIFPEGLHRREYTPGHKYNKLVYSSIDWKWRSLQGKSMDKGLFYAVHDELQRPKTGAKKKERGPNLELLSTLLWTMMGFVYSSRYLKTRAEALILCVFHVLADQYPELFKDVLMRESRSYIRRHVTKPYKFQRTIDLNPTGGLNYGSLEGIRKGVEELSKYQMGVIPSTSTIARTARKLELHAANDHGLVVLQSSTPHGPVFSFEIHNFLRLILKGFGLIDHARTGAASRPVMLCWTLDYAQLTRELGHLTGGIKIVDPRSKDPMNGNLLLLQGKFQSRELSFHV